MERKYEFSRGWQKIQNTYGKRVQAEVKKELMGVIGINNRNSWGLWKSGVFSDTIKLAQLKGIIAVFTKYGVKRKNIWGKEDTTNE